MPTTSLLTRYSTACPCAQFSEATKKPQAREKVRFLTAFSVNHFFFFQMSELYLKRLQRVYWLPIR
jgi:hypothetical protein